MCSNPSLRSLYQTLPLKLSQLRAQRQFPNIVVHLSSQQFVRPTALASNAQVNLCAVKSAQASTSSVILSYYHIIICQLPAQKRLSHMSMNTISVNTFQNAISISIMITKTLTTYSTPKPRLLITPLAFSNETLGAIKIKICHIVKEHLSFLSLIMPTSQCLGNQRSWEISKIFKG